MAEFGATTALWINAASFLVSAGLVATVIPVVHRKSQAETPRYLGELADGFRFVWNHRLMRAIVLTVLVTNFLDAPFGVVMPVYALEAFGSAVDLGLMFGVFGGFALASSLGFSVIGHRLPRRLLVRLLLRGLGVRLPRPRDSPVATSRPLVALAVGGLAVGPISRSSSPWDTSRSSHMRGRVIGVLTAGAWAAIPAGILLGAILVDALGVAAALFAIGLCYLAVTTYSFFNPAFERWIAVPTRPSFG